MSAHEHHGRNEHHGHHDHGSHDHGNDSVASVLSPRAERLLDKIFGEETVKNAEEFYFAKVDPLPGFEAEGRVLMAFDDDTDTLTVVVAARGIEANMPHLQHIHGFTDNTTDSKSPTLAQDDDGDGIVELGEGLETYGPILVNLTAPPGSGSSGFPVADENGTYFFRETYQLPSELLPGNPQLTLREIVLHGQTLEEGQGSNGGEADGTAGFKVVLPVASGEIQNITALEGLGFLKDINKIMKHTEGGVIADGSIGEHHHDFAHG